MGKPSMRDEDSRRRVLIEGVRAEVDGGRFPIRRIVDEKVVVEADVLADGHDALSCVLLYRKEGDPQWIEVAMEALVNDRWRGEFTVTELGRYCYMLQAWIDRFQSWQKDLQKRVDAGQDVSVELLVGASLVRIALAAIDRKVSLLGLSTAAQDEEGGAPKNGGLMEIGDADVFWKEARKLEATIRADYEIIIAALRRGENVPEFRPPGPGVAELMEAEWKQKRACAEDPGEPADRKEHRKGDDGPCG